MLNMMKKIKNITFGYSSDAITEEELITKMKNTIENTGRFNEIKESLLIAADSYSSHWIDSINNATTIQELDCIERALDDMIDY